MNLLDAAGGGAGLGEDEVAVGAAQRLTRQTAVAHELVKLGAVHVSACLWSRANDRGGWQKVLGYYCCLTFDKCSMAHQALLFVLDEG